ncbi:alcohol dehydrogenase catalytic domain-containing protein [Paenibacillus hexagrammi]|uniref:Alcohol dehydrogenase catalytic domain-containing protein n=1 Tax=Paenibacillus hexagrammi TaxID=2908839 RepID=A0ABY3SDV1_9BACL|nr:alcohol dehydrogenase catalytic domain-containing protein [Paenibacillus sp. YPD9-1]UJF32012.1 alcohol dehydrogenase catalytic domain-containing protein [Paenibacillus sp. YPD9-1]
MKDKQSNERVVVTQYGGPGVLKLIEEAMPQPLAGEVRIKVQAAGVALADAMRREGRYPGSPSTPFTPGYDIVGIIDAIGIQVDPRIGLGTKAAAFFLA